MSDRYGLTTISTELHDDGVLVGTWSTTTS